MDVLFDLQFLVLYILKAVRIGLIYLALFLATKIFTPMYEEKVYDEKTNPPHLIIYLLIFIAFDFSFNIFVLIVLFLLKFLFKSDDNAFVVDKYLFTKFIADYFMSTIFLLLLGIMIAIVVMSKKYFKYKYEGLRAIRAYQDMVFFISIFVVLFPYFWLI